jgi:hypothetical protein
MGRQYRHPDMRKLRKYAESMMTDRVRVVRPAGVHVDPDTGVETPAGATIYEGPCKLQTSGGIATQNVGQSSMGGLISQWGLYLHLPITVAGLREKDTAVIIKAHDPDLVGRRYRLVNMQSEKTHATARRWNVMEIPGKEDAHAD